MEENAQMYDLAALSMKKEFAICTEYEASWPAKPVWML
jgi:hypothetical protein